MASSNSQSQFFSEIAEEQTRTLKKVWKSRSSPHCWVSGTKWSQVGPVASSQDRASCNCTTKASVFATQALNTEREREVRLECKREGLGSCWRCTTLLIFLPIRQLSAKMLSPHLHAFYTGLTLNCHNISAITLLDFGYLQFRAIMKHKKSPTSVMYES